MIFFKRLFFRGVSIAAKVTGLSEQFVSFLIMGGVNTVFYYVLYSC